MKEAQAKYTAQIRQMTTDHNMQMELLATQHQALLKTTQEIQAQQSNSMQIMQTQCEAAGRELLNLRSYVEQLQKQNAEDEVSLRTTPDCGA